MRIMIIDLDDNMYVWNEYMILFWHRIEQGGRKLSWRDMRSDRYLFDLVSSEARRSYRELMDFYEHLHSYIFDKLINASPDTNLLVIDLSLFDEDLYTVEAIAIEDAANHEEQVSMNNG